MGTHSVVMVALVMLRAWTVIFAVTAVATVFRALPGQVRRKRVIELFIRTHLVDVESVQHWREEHA